jgi:Putative Actinobacterial Holin-X, holin superfamily III
MTSHIPGVPDRDLLQPLTEQLGAVVHREVERVWRETTRPYQESRTGVRLLGGSAVLGSMAAGSATALLIRVLDRRLPPAASAAVAAAVLGAGASVLAQAGRARMRGAVGPPQAAVAAQDRAPQGPESRDPAT